MSSAWTVPLKTSVFKKDLTRMKLMENEPLMKFSLIKNSFAFYKRRGSETSKRQQISSSK